MVGVGVVVQVSVGGGEDGREWVSGELLGILGERVVNERGTGGEVEG